jgi:hypothetical protein
LLALLLMAWLILDGLKLTVWPKAALILCAIVPLSMFAAEPGFLNTQTGDPGTNHLIASLPKDIGKVHFTYDAPDWLTFVGVASRWEHEHRPFCVDDWGWDLPFGKDTGCQAIGDMKNVILTHEPRPCEPPCRILSKDEQFEFELNPYPELRLPFTLNADDISSLHSGFYEKGDGPVWASGLAKIHFLLAPGFGGSNGERLRIFGFANPGGPARILLNGHLLGTINPGPLQSDFVVPPNLLVAGENELMFQVDHPAKVKGDPRSLGFYFIKVQFDAL